MIVKLPYLYCDGENCPRQGEAFYHATGPGETGQMQRKRAQKKAGWKRVKGRDLCPECFKASRESR